MKLSRIHHVAYRCKDAKETVEWYGKYLGMEFQLAFAEDHVPSTNAADPYMHIFLDAGGGNVLAFFEVPNSPEMGRDPNTPEWVQHLAFEVPTMQELEEARQRLVGGGIPVVGITDHALFKSIYFFDPNGHRLELAVNTSTSQMAARASAVKWEMLEEWSRTKRAPKHAAWMHAKEFAENAE